MQTKGSRTRIKATALAELRPLSELQRDLAQIFPSQGSLAWEIRSNRAEYVKGGALFEIAGRLMAHPPTFERIALAIGARKIAGRAA